LVRTTIERAARLGDGVVLVALDWDETRTKVGWYRNAGGNGTVVVNTIPSYLSAEATDAAIIDAVLADADRAVSVGASEMHISLNLIFPVPPDRQVELLGAIAEKLGLAGPGTARA
jgi:hypothetical protein